MCGIFGVIAKDPRGLYVPHGEIFKEGLIADSLRGMDSTGVFGVSCRNEVSIVKQAVDPYIFLRTKAADQWLKRTMDFRIMIGHNRKATSGSIVSKNAHPFREKDIVLVHNGAVYNHKELNKEVEVDSHALCHSFAEKGAVETIKNVRGAFALVWYNIKEKALYMWRNEERPLAICERDQDIVISSEMKMLEWIMTREHRANLAANNKYREVSKDTLVKMTFDPFMMTTQDLKEKPITTTAHWYGSEHSNMISHSYPVHESTNDVAAIEHWMAERGEEKATATKTGLDGKAVMKLYPFNSNVLFRVGTIKKWQDKPLQWVIDGLAYLPGRAAIDARFYTDSKFDVEQFKTWKKAGTIQAKVKIVVSKDNNVSLHLQDCILPDTVLVFNNTLYPKMEWSLLRGSEKCFACKRSLTTSKPELTSVNSKSTQPGVYKVHCDDCVLTSIPPEKRDALLKSRALALQNSQSEC